MSKFEFECRYLKGKTCAYETVCCFYCQYLKECLVKWRKFNYRNIYCKIKKGDRYCSGVVGYFRDNKKPEQIKIKVILIWVLGIMMINLSFEDYEVVCYECKFHDKCHKNGIDYDKIERCKMRKIIREQYRIWQKRKEKPKPIKVILIW